MVQKIYTMKYVFLIVASVFLFGIGGCKKDGFTTATVVRDCTGTYLRWEEKDYHVCNLEKVEPFAHGTKVRVLFKSIHECKGSAVGVPVCEMYHPSEGWIEVIKIQ